MSLPAAPEYDFNFDDTPEEVRALFTPEILEDMSREDLLLIRWVISWKQMARKKQLPPEEFVNFVKMIWGIRSGRGFGKTLCAANWLGLRAAQEKGDYAAVAPTHDDVKLTCFEGPTGLMSVIPAGLIAGFNKSQPSITLRNGSFIRGFAGDTPERLRGPNLSAVWCDEIASWRSPQEAWDNIMFALRVGEHPQLVWTGTPKPTPFVRALQKHPNSIVVVGSTYENKENLTDFFFDNVAKYKGTKVGRQELYGEVLDPEEEGFVKRSQWRLWPHDRPIPQLDFLVMSLDTAFTERQHDKKKQENDPTACSVWGIFSVARKGKPPVKHVLLLDAWEDWLGFPELVSRVKKERVFTYGDRDEPLLKPTSVPRAQRARHQGRKIDIILIEEKASGKSLMQQLANENVMTHGYNPGNNDKLTRLHYVSPMFAAGRVWAMESSLSDHTGKFVTWSDPLISQICSYVGVGSTDRDDLLDTTTQALRFLMDKFFGPFTVRDNSEDQARLEAKRVAERKNKRNPYG